MGGVKARMCVGGPQNWEGGDKEWGSGGGGGLILGGSDWKGDDGGGMCVGESDLRGL